MGFIETVNKYAYKTTISQSCIYKEIEQAKSSIEAMGLPVKIKTEFDLFDYEVIYRGMLTQNRIENTYEIFLSQHYDLLDYLNYDEKRKMFNNDISPILKEAPHFYDGKSQSEIYIPYLEDFVNQRYIYDYQLMMLKQHHDYVKNYHITLDQPHKLYEIDMYATDFSSLVNVYEDERHICYYYDDLKTIYIFKKGTHELLNQMILGDRQQTSPLHIEVVKEIAYDIENYLYQECLEFMKNQALISEKTYKKIMKKYK